MDLVTGTMAQTECELSQEQIEVSAKILANILLDYVNNGGSVAELIPEKLFGKRGGKNE
ncbi:MAG: hypothetical protein HFE29_01685 [Clostridia bacterium]|nr:hypothetical protein [Clostridia bacterium]